MTISPYDAAQEAADFLNGICKAPKIAIVLGSGLGAFAQRLDDAQAVPYERSPHFPKVGVVGHAGQLVVGCLPGTSVRVAAMSGRVHLYEGHPMSTVVHPVRTMGLWGVDSMIFTNAAGAIQNGFVPGNLMLITDHINLSGENPLVGHNDEQLGTRFPDMSSAYSPDYCESIRQAAQSTGVDLKEGVYAGLKGPSYETPAEIRMLGIVGADAVGMSTVCEVIAALSIQVAGISLNHLAAGISADALDHAEVKPIANQSRDAFVQLIERSIMNILGHGSGDAH